MPKMYKAMLVSEAMGNVVDSDVAKREITRGRAKCTATVVQPVTLAHTQWNPIWPLLCVSLCLGLSCRSGALCQQATEIHSISAVPWPSRVHVAHHSARSKQVQLDRTNHYRSLLTRITPKEDNTPLGDNRISSLLSRHKPARQATHHSDQWASDQFRWANEPHLSPLKPINNLTHSDRQANAPKESLLQHSCRSCALSSSTTVDIANSRNQQQQPLQHRKHHKRQTHESKTNWMMAAISTIKIMCRTEWGHELAFDKYVLDTCARCYHYMPDTAFKPAYKFSYSFADFGLLTHEGFNTTLYSNETIQLSETFSSLPLVLKWQQCCTDAILCCVNYHKKYHNLLKPDSVDIVESNKTDQLINNNQADLQMCPPTWDGWLCWDEFAQPNQTLERSCPKHIYWHQLVPPCRGYVTKMCNSTGQWYVNQDNKEWSNYTMCARDDIYARRIQYSLVTNVISVCALIPALVIFTHYKQLSSMSRIRLHKHLFTSLLFHAIISALLKWHLLHTTFDRSPDSSHAFHHQPASSSSTSVASLRMPSLCLVLSVLLRYFRSTNYLWMFNEALYLHQLIKHAFSQPSLRPLIILAYSLPFVTTTSYIFARYMSTTSNLASFDDSVESPSIDFNAQFSSNFDQTLPSLSPTSPTNSELAMAVSRNQFALYHKQLDDQVHHALSSLIRLPTIRQHLHEAVKVQQEMPFRGPDSVGWLNDLLDGGGGGLAAAERLVADDVAVHKSSGLSSGTNQSATDHDSGQRVLDNLEVLEEASPLIEEDNCWLMPSYENWHEWIINVPNLAILIINCFFLLWLLRVLCIKAAATMTSNNSRNHGPNSSTVTSSPTQHHLNGCQYNSRNHYHQQSVFSRQSILVSLRAAVLLLPLYGLHYLLIVYRPKIENCWFSETYHYLSLSLDGLQGLAVSIIFCFANSEIRHLLTRSLQRVGTRQRSTTIYMTEVAATNRD